MVPPFGRLLSQPRPVAHHALDEVVRHAQASVGPITPLPEVAASDPNGDAKPERQQNRLAQPASAHAEHAKSDDEFDGSESSQKASAQRQGLHSFRFDYPSEQLADT